MHARPTVRPWAPPTLRLLPLWSLRTARWAPLCLQAGSRPSTTLWEMDGVSPSSGQKIRAKTEKSKPGPAGRESL